MYRSWIIVASTLLGLASFESAQAAVSVVVQSETVTSSVKATTSGYFDVYLTVTGTNANLNAYQTAVTITPSSVLTLGTPTATDATSPARTMQLSSANFLSPNGQDVNTASRVSATDYLNGTASMTLATGDGLLRVPFTLAAGAQGTFQLLLDTSDPAGTFLASAAGAEINYTAVNGTLTVVTPEPGTASLGVIGGVALLHRRRRRPRSY